MKCSKGFEISFGKPSSIVQLKAKLMDNYFSMSVQSVGLQVLETVYIIETTKNYDTIKGRYKLLVERIQTLRNAETNRLYSEDINNSIKSYKSMYFDRPFLDIQLSAILKPNIFNVQIFYCAALVNCIKRFVEEQTNEIDGLKNENAKIKRRLKVMDKIKLAKEELKNECESTSFYLSSLNTLEAIQSSLNK
jgi:hypothetical protein